MSCAATESALAAHVERLRPYLQRDAVLREVSGLPAGLFAACTPALHANMHYFGHPRWMQSWIASVHRRPALRERWQAAAGTWDGKVVVDVGCGPGNLFLTLGGAPETLIGVDVAAASLEIATANGYVPLLADAHAMPLRSQFADLVALNATVHHCDDMETVVREAARLVRPGGAIVIDHDPQLSAWRFRGLGRLVWELRAPVYRLLGRSGHSRKEDEQRWASATEAHHSPGDGLSEPLVRRWLETAGFEVAVYPHNHTAGAEVLAGEMGDKALRYACCQLLSGIDPRRRAAALSLLVVGRRSPAGARRRRD